MPTVAVDTDIVSFAFKKDTRAQLYRRHLTGRLQVISFMTLAELDAWARARQWGQARRDKLERHLQRFAVVYADCDLCRWWADVTEGARAKGRPIDKADAWHAALALSLAVPLVTHKPGDYAGVDGLTILTEAAP